MTSTTESTVHNQNCNNDQQNQNDPSSPLINLIDSINLTNLSEYYDNKTDILFKLCNISLIVRPLKRAQGIGTKKLVEEGVNIRNVVFAALLCCPEVRK